MLALMRDPQVPLKDRIELAAITAPFVHARPQPARKSDLLDLQGQVGESEDLKYGLWEPKPEAGGGGGLSPLDFLLGVMSDPAATPRQRVKAAGVAARYKHALAATEPEATPTVIVVEDKFGFKIDPELARAERDDMQSWRWLDGARLLHRDDPDWKKAAKEKREQIYKRCAERVALLKYPECYTLEDLENDHKRLRQIRKARHGGQELTPKEAAEEVHLSVRARNPKVVNELRAVPISIDIEWPTTRIAELDERVVGGETLTAEEEAERLDLRQRYPESAAQADRIDHRYRYWRRKERESAEKSGMDHGNADRLSKEKCERLRDPRKIAFADIPSGLSGKISRLESLRFDGLLTREEANELEELHRLYPRKAEYIRSAVNRRFSSYQASRGSNPPPILQGEWPRVWTSPADNARSRTPERRPLVDDEFTPPDQPLARD